MKSKKILMLFAFSLCAAPAVVADEDPRQLVELPAQMRQHMLNNMRDHLLSISEIQQALSSASFDTAADIAENRLGMSSLDSHGASHMATFMPLQMRNIGTEMHRSASQFAIIAQESAINGDFKKALSGLAKITEKCVACHAAFRVH